MNKNFIKIIGILCIIIVIANLLLASFLVYSWTIFWIVIIVMALVAFPGMNWLRRLK